MSSPTLPPSFWIRWLLIASAGVILFGLGLVVVPAIARQGFSLLVYSSSSRLDNFGPEQVRYISLSHAVIGGVMVGWGFALLLVTRELLAKGSRLGWNLIAISLGAWFIPDTTYSLLSGYWQNAALNIVFLALFALPLWVIGHYVQDDA
jgi:hypothetical protein